MSNQADEFIQALRAAFTSEAADHLEALFKGLLEMEKTPDPERQASLLETICREAHSLKGAARAVNLTDIEGICQSLESVLSSWKRHESSPTSAAYDVVHRALDTLRTMTETPGEVSLSRAAELKVQLTKLLTNGALRKSERRAPEVPLESGSTPLAPLSVSEKAPTLETVRLPSVRLERLLLKLEEMLALRLSMRRSVRELDQLSNGFERRKREYVKVASAVRALRGSEFSSGEGARPGFAALAEFLERQQTFVKSVEGSLLALGRSAQRDQHALEMLVDSLLAESKQLLMLPCSALLGMLPKLVRDLCHDQGKEADIEVRGAEIEIDKRILQEFKDPLIHLVRNCVDHGIESPGKRTERHKPPRGAITVTVSPIEGGKVELRIGDDGAGIDIAQVKASAVRRKVVSAAAAKRLTPDEALELIFRSDVSTSPVVTDLSGRGLGLAIVRERVEKLGGRVNVETTVGGGTTFRVVVPLTLATFRGLLIEAAGGQFVVPTAHIERVFRIRSDVIRTDGNRQFIAVDGRDVSVVRIEAMLGLHRLEKPQRMENVFIPVMVLVSGEKRVACIVDAVLTEEEVLVKPLTRPLVRVRNVTGITVLGSGKAVPVLNAMDLVKTAVRGGIPQSVMSDFMEEKGGEPKRILVVEDSITARMLIKNILESAGYGVKTAVDGLEAMKFLMADEFDAVVSDVEMPRMNGFRLTEGIRADPRLASKPVVLVTALSSPEDRQRGIRVGANAYIVKSDFDQSDLLNVLRRLV
jgi:two-component system chemotaxis sensor kinase CheA